MIKESARQWLCRLLFSLLLRQMRKSAKAFPLPFGCGVDGEFLTIFRVFARINGFYGQRNHNNGEHPCQDIRDSRAEGDLQQLYFVNSAIKLIGKRCC